MQEQTIFVEALEKANPAVHSQCKVSEPKGWLFFGKVYAIDGKKLGEVQGKLQKLREDLTKAAHCCESAIPISDTSEIFRSSRNLIQPVRPVPGPGSPAGRAAAVRSATM